MSILLDHVVKTIPHPFLVVCEGYGDARFIVKLLGHLKIRNCNVGCPSMTGGHGTGITAIPNYLNAVRGVIQIGTANLSGLLVIPDADKHPGNCFSDICTALTDAMFPIPSQPFSVEGNPMRTAVFIMPGKGRTGTLEHLLWDAATTQNPKLKKCVDRFCRCTGGHINSAPENAKVKMKMSAIVAAHCQGNPWASPAWMWSEKDNPVPIDSPCFKEVSDFLTVFTT
ncbi:MAG: DUF3226 domain-containing protein [Acidobacteriaceae bacterium]|jgi:hypothetical protein